MKRIARTAASVFAILAALSARAAADTKQECIAAADAGQELRDKGRLIDARQQFVACARDACPAAVRKQCAAWLADVEAAIPTLVFQATRGGNDVTEVRVTMDGKPLLDRFGGDSVPVDPGTHAFRFELAGSEPVSRDVVVRQGEKLQKIAVAFAAPPPAAAAPAPTSAPANEARASDARQAAPGPRSERALELVLLNGVSVPIGFVRAGTLGPLPWVDIEAAWRPGPAFDLGGFVDVAFGNLTLDESAAADAGVERGAGYGRLALGVRARWFIVHATRVDVWLGAEALAMGENWKFTGTTPDAGFGYGTWTLGGGALAGVDLKLTRAISAGLVARGFASVGPHGSRAACGTAAQCDGEVPGGTRASRTFFDAGLRARWSLML